MAYLSGRKFIGLRTNADPRNIKPNKDNEGVFESVEMTNFDIQGEGAMITSQGFEAVSNVAGSGGVLNLLNYEKTTDDRWLLITYDDDHYSISPTNTTWSDTNLGDYGTVGNIVGGTVYNGTGTAATGTITISSYGDLVSGSNRDFVKIFLTTLQAITGAATESESNFQAATSNDATASSLCVQINAHPSLKLGVYATVSGAIVTITSKTVGETGNGYGLIYTDTTGADGMTLSGAALTGGSSGRIAVLGNDISANTTQRITISAAMADAGAGAPDGHIMAVFMGRLFIADGRNINYSAVEDETVSEGVITFNDIVTGMRVEGKRMIVFTRTYHQGIFFDYNDTFNISTPLKEPYERPFGCLAPKTIQSTGSDVYYWSPRGVMRLGAEMDYTEGAPRPRSVSKKIENSLEKNNWKNRDKANSVFWEEKRQYWMATPFDTSTIPDKVWVYWEDWDAWTLRDGFFPGDMELFRNSDYKNELYFGDASSPYLYKFNNDYSYDGVGYTRRWKSKIFTMGTNIQFKQFKRLDLTGAMDTGTEFFVTLEVDGVKKKYKIDNDFLILNSYSEYIGDLIYGNEWVGGDSPAESRFKRFYAPLDFDKEIREGMELQITIENDGAEMPFKIDFLGIEYDLLPRKQVPRRRYVNTQVST